MLKFLVSLALLLPLCLSAQNMTISVSFDWDFVERELDYLDSPDYRTELILRKDYIESLPEFVDRIIEMESKNIESRMKVIESELFYINTPDYITELGTRGLGEEELNERLAVISKMIITEFEEYDRELHYIQSPDYRTEMLLKLERGDVDYIVDKLVANEKSLFLRTSLINAVKNGDAEFARMISAEYLKISGMQSFHNEITSFIAKAEGTPICECQDVYVALDVFITESSVVLEEAEKLNHPLCELKQEIAAAALCNKIQTLSKCCANYMDYIKILEKDHVTDELSASNRFLANVIKNRCM